MGLGYGDCDTDVEAHVVEVGDVVVVGGTLTPPAPGTACTLVLRSALATLGLARPLGERVVVDVVSGSVLSVHRG